MGKTNSKKINGLTVSNRVKQGLPVTVYNFKNALSPKYMGDIYSLQVSPNIWTRRSTDSFLKPFYEKEIARKSISYLEHVYMRPEVNSNRFEI